MSLCYKRWGRKMIKLYLFLMIYWNTVSSIWSSWSRVSNRPFRSGGKPPFSSSLPLLFVSSRWSGCYATAKVQGSGKCFMLIKGCYTAELLTSHVQGPCLVPVSDLRTKGNDKALTLHCPSFSSLTCIHEALIDQCGLEWKWAGISMTVGQTMRRLGGGTARNLEWLMCATGYCHHSSPCWGPCIYTCLHQQTCFCSVAHWGLKNT